MALDSLLLDLPLPPDVPGGMPRYRQTLAMSFLFKAIMKFRLEAFGREAVDANTLTATDRFHREQTKSTHLFEARHLYVAVEGSL